MLTTVVLVQSLSERILPYHHVEVGRVQFFPQMKNNREGQITITAGQSENVSWQFYYATVC